jgi:hypothetical protein
MQRRIWTFCLAGALLLATCFVLGTIRAQPPSEQTPGALAADRFPSYSAGCSTGKWLAAMPAPVPVARYAFAQNGTDFYLMGGQIGSGVNAALKYSTATNQWSSLPSIPVPGGGSYPAAAYFEGKIYVVGGLTDDPGNTLHIYDIASNTWTAGPNMLQHTYGAAAGAYGGKVYVAGGLIRFALHIYDIAQNGWSTGSSLPAEHYEGGYTQAGQYLYMVGSSNGGTATQRLDMATGTVTLGPAWTPARYDMAGASDGAKLYAIGGRGGAGASAQVDELDLAGWPGGNWTPSGSLPAPRQANRAGFSTGLRIWSTGGVDAGGIRVTDNLYRDPQTCPTGTPTVTPVATLTAAPTTAFSATPSASNTPSASPTQSAGATLTPTGTPVASTRTSTPPVTATATACSLRFADVAQSNPFYAFVRCLACLRIVSGYSCGGQDEPCNSDADPYFRPNTDITRGQIAKVVSEAARFGDDPGPQVYEDVPQGSPFFVWINRLSNRGLVSGYRCGDAAGEPCAGPANRPYFRPNRNATRGQLARIASNAADLQDPATVQTYADVPPSNPFYVYIERLSAVGVVSGYTCGTLPHEPCDAEHRPYFRWANNVTRGQASKIVANTFFSGCQVAHRADGN